ncbi:MAG: FtsQ-type POTRA domain-containing protein [Alphaproteobacteria bacterium]|nr:FtsQ-type POTRA domain-containing protein [Alphaproteobacteria bacterium]
MRLLRRSASGRGSGRKRKTRRRSRRRTRMFGRVTLRRAVFVGLVVGLVALPVWWWWSGGMARSWQSAKAIAKESTEQLVTGLGFSLQDVLVEGRDRTATAALKRALGARHGAPLLTLDLDAAKARIEALPWVRDAALRRLLPDTLHVTLVERTPLARWQRQRKIRIIDADGEVIPVKVAREHKGLPLVVGADAPAHTVALIDLVKSQPILAERVAAAVRKGGRRWDIKLRGGIEVRLPEEDAAVAWRRLAEAERDHAVLARDIVLIDLRIPDRMIVQTRKPASSKEKPVRRSTSEKST